MLYTIRYNQKWFVLKFPSCVWGIFATFSSGCYYLLTSDTANFLLFSVACFLDGCIGPLHPSLQLVTVVQPGKIRMFLFGEEKKPMKKAMWFGESPIKFPPKPPKNIPKLICSPDFSAGGKPVSSLYWQVPSSHKMRLLPFSILLSILATQSHVVLAGDHELLKTSDLLMKPEP